MESPNHQAIKSFAELVKSNKPGFPKSIYDDGKVKLQFWKNDWSDLCLLIHNNVFSDLEKRSYWKRPGDTERICLKPPMGIDPRITATLKDYDEDVEQELIVTDQYLVVRLEDGIAEEIGNLFKMRGLEYDTKIYDEFLNAHANDRERLDEKYYSCQPSRPIHPNIAILRQQLNELDSMIDEANLDTEDRDEYEKAIEFLRDENGFMFETIHRLMEEIPNEGGSREEDAARSDIEHRLADIECKRRNKLEELD